MKGLTLGRPQVRLVRMVAAATLLAAIGLTALTSEVAGAATNTQVMAVTTSLPNGTLNTPYSATLQATGGSGSYNWSICPSGCGSLPPGLRLSPSGVISGTPSFFGQAQFDVFVVDSHDSSNAWSQYLTLTIGSGTSDDATLVPLGTLVMPYLTGSVVEGQVTPIEGQIQATLNAITAIPLSILGQIEAIALSLNCTLHLACP
jgi:hypothetical protein